jgi:phosphoglycerol geranylgeranyltransferase
MVASFYKDLTDKIHSGKKAFALLIDPDEYSPDQLRETLRLADEHGVDYLFLGGSLLTGGKLETCIRLGREETNIPLVLYPGSHLQFHPGADALLFLTLISGRNPDLLIGRHVEIAPYVIQSGIETVPTGYMLIDGGAATSVSYISNTMPIPANKPGIAVNTAQAGELLGLKAIFMDAGSGAANTVSTTMIRRVKENISLPLLIGGGIRTPEEVSDAARAGADVIVVGNALENNSFKIPEMTAALRNLAPGLEK